MTERPVHRLERYGVALPGVPKAIVVREELAGDIGRLALDEWCHRLWKLCSPDQVDVLLRYVPLLWFLTSTTAISAPKWLDLFRVIAFTIVGDGDPPTAPVRLWRGGTALNRVGIAWTDRRDVAEWYAGQASARSGAPGVVVKAEVPVEALLARLEADDFSEWIVDVDRLDPDAIDDVTLTEGVVAA